MVQQNRITARTNLLGLIGHPVDHSLSPVFQNAALNALNLDYVYLAFDISTGDLMDCSDASNLAIEGNKRYSSTQGKNYSMVG